MNTQTITGTLHGRPEQKVSFTLHLPPIGFGGNAWVYRAHSEDGTGDTNANYIVKILKPTINGMMLHEDDKRIWLEADKSCPFSPEAAFELRKQMMLDEARYMHAYQTEGVCMNISAVFDYKGSVAVAMPISGGSTLSDEHNEIENSDDVLQVIRDTIQITERISILHRRGELHMDIAPDNLFRQKNGAISLLDFGSVCKANTPVVCFSRKQGFSAPETEDLRSTGIIKKQFGFEADIYAIGAVLYYNLFAKTFDRRRPGAYFFDEVDELPVNQGSKEQLKYILKNTLAFTLELRCNDISELLDDLKELEVLLQGYGVSRMRLYQKSVDAHIRCLKTNALFGQTADESLFALDRPAGDDKTEKLINSDKNYLVYGDSGSGKTTLLMLMWNLMLDRRKSDRNAAVPLLISLSSCPDCSGWRSGDPLESYILRALCVSCFGAADFSSCPADVLSGIWEEFSKYSDHPEYCLLIDGLDESPSENRSILIDELNRFSKLDNVRLIVASRGSEPGLESFEICRFVGISENSIINYLRKHGFSPTECSAISNNRTLLSLLCSPMYLSMAVQMKQSNISVADITRSGQMLNRYFNSDIPGRTSELQRLRRMTKGRNEQFNMQLVFIYNHLLPFIAFRVESSGRHILTRAQLEETIHSALDENSGWFASELFIEQKPEYADTVLSLYCSDSALKTKASVNRIVRVICMALFLMTEHNSCFEFVNRTVESYFTARYICSALELSVCAGDYSALTDLCRTRWREDTMRIAGDILYDSDSSAADRALDMLRGKSGQESPSAAAAIIGLMLARDRTLDGKNLSDLNLSKCTLADASCKGTTFERSILSDEVILGVGSNTYTSAVSPDGSCVFLMAGNGCCTVVDTAANERKRIALDSRCDMCICARIVGPEIFTLGRLDGGLGLCIEINSPDGTLRKALPIDAPKYDPARQYKDILAAFSDDGSWLAISGSPVYLKSSGELLLIDCASVGHYSLDAGSDVTGLRFASGNLHILCRSGVCRTIILDSITFADSDERAIRDRLDEAVLTEENGELFLVHANERRSLNISHKFTRTKGTRYTLCCDGSEWVCLVRPKETGVSYLAYFDNTPMRTIHADVLELCSAQTALVMRSELSYDGQERKCFGLYDIIHERWIVREQSHRGMQCGAISGERLLMTRGGENVICDINSGRFSPPKDNVDVRIWLSASDEDWLSESTSGSAILMRSKDDRESLISKDTLGIGGKCRLSVLNMSDNLRYAAVQADANQNKSLYLYDRENTETERLTLEYTMFGHAQAHILRSGRVALLAETGSEKHWVLQVCGEDTPPLFCDVSKHKSATSKLMLLHDGEELYLVSFGRSRSRKPWRYGRTSVTRIIIGNDGISFDETRHYPGCCVSNPRVTCRYTESRQLVMKKRYTDSEYILLDLRTGKERSIYLDGLRLEGSSFAGAVGLSDRAKEILRNAGAKTE